MNLNQIKKNWKTTLHGLALIAILVAYLFNKITGEQFTTATGFIVASGFFASKDGDKTGV